MSAKYETSGDAATVNPLIIIIRGVVGRRHRPRHPRRRESSFALLRYIIDTCARDAMGRREAGARTKGQSSFSGSFLPYYPCLVVRLTRHAYKAVFITAVTGQWVVPVRDLSRRGEVEREYSSRSQNINRSACQRSVANGRHRDCIFGAPYGITGGFCGRREDYPTEATSLYFHVPIS